MANMYTFLLGPPGELIWRSDKITGAEKLPATAISCTDPQGLHGGGLQSRPCFLRPCVSSSQSMGVQCCEESFRQKNTVKPK